MGAIEENTQRLLMFMKSVDDRLLQIELSLRLLATPMWVVPKVADMDFKALQQPNGFVMVEPPVCNYIAPVVGSTLKGGCTE